MMKVLSQRKKPAPGQISWEQILTNLEDGVITVDQDGKIVFFNEAAEAQRAATVLENFGLVAPGVVQYTTDR